MIGHIINIVITIYFSLMIILAVLSTIEEIKEEQKKHKEFNKINKYDFYKSKDIRFGMRKVKSMSEFYNIEKTIKYP